MLPQLHYCRPEGLARGRSDESRVVSSDVRRRPRVVAWRCGELSAAGVQRVEPSAHPTAVARMLRERLGIAEVVVHSVAIAASSTAQGDVFLDR